MLTVWLQGTAILFSGEEMHAPCQIRRLSQSSSIIYRSGQFVPQFGLQLEENILRANFLPNSSYIQVWLLFSSEVSQKTKNTLLINPTPNNFPSSTATTRRTSDTTWTGLIDSSNPGGTSRWHTYLDTVRIVAQIVDASLNVVENLLRCF